MTDSKYPFEALHLKPSPVADMERRSAEFLKTMQTRRTVRDLASTPVPQSIIENAVATAATAPSGANMQPWYFVAVKDAAIKSKICCKCQSCGLIA